MLQDAYIPTAVPAAVGSPALKTQATMALRTSSSAGQLQHRSSRYSRSAATVLQSKAHAGHAGPLQGSALATLAASSMGAAVIAAAVAAMIEYSCSCRTSHSARQVSTAATASEDTLKGYTSGYIDGRFAACRTGDSSSGGGASGSGGCRRVSSLGGASAQTAQLSRHSSTSALDSAQKPCSELHGSTAVAEQQQQPLVSAHLTGLAWHVARTDPLHHHLLQHCAAPQPSHMLCSA
jgi:hypothetical protein